MKIETYTIDETEALAVKVGALLKKGDFLALNGDLGAGKTTFIKGIAKGMGLKDTRYVNSPTFVILHEYETHIPLFHFDVYRLGHSEELNEIGYKEYFYGEGVSVVEWADKIHDIIPDEHIRITIDIAGETHRSFQLEAVGAKHKNLISKLGNSYV